MKTFILILALLPLFSQGQSYGPFVNRDSLMKKYSIISPTNNYRIMGGEFTQPSIIFMGKNSKFALKFSGDSLIINTDMCIDESGKIFIDYCKKYVHNRIDSLENELINTKKAYLFEKSRFEKLSHEVKKLTDVIDKRTKIK